MTAIPPPDFRALYEGLFEHIGEGVFLGRADGTIVRANPAACRMLGWSEAELIRLGRAGIVVEDDLFREMLERRREVGVVSGPVHYRRSDGRTIPVELTSTSVPGPVGEPLTYTIFRDISDRKRADDERQELQRHLEAVLLGSAAGFWEIDLRTRRVRRTGRFAEIRGRESEASEVSLEEGMTPVHPEDHPKVMAAFAAVMSGEKEAVHLEYRVRVADGSWRWVRTHGKAVEFDADGRPVRAAGSMTDVQAEREAAAALREREQRLTDYFETPAVGIAITSLEKGWMEANDQVCAMLGYSREELRVRTWADLTHPDDVAADVAQFDRVLTGEIDRYALDKRFLRKDGEVVWTLLSVSCVRRADRSIDYFVAILTDIGERKAAEERLQESENLFRTLAAASPVGIFLADGSGNNVFLSPAGQRTLGISATQASGAGWIAAVHPEDRERFLREMAAATVGEFNSECRYLKPTGQVTWARVVGSPMRGASGEVAGFVGVIIDVTSQRALQEQVAIGSRLAAMGTLVAGVAHEINNPLGGMLASDGFALEEAERLRDELRSRKPVPASRMAEELDRVVEALRDAQGEGLRIGEIVKDLTLLGRPDAGRMRVQLREVVEKAVRSLPPALASGAAIRIDDRASPGVTAAAGQLVQVFANLLTNAVRASRPGIPIEVTVTVGTGSPGMVRAEVADNGCGMPPDLMGRIFDPFFTTRKTGQGMGLGLPICHAIVTAHGGTITVESTPGAGSTFRVELPAAPE